MNMNKLNSKKETLIVIFSVLIFLVISMTIIMIVNNKKTTNIENEVYQSSLTIPGFELDKPFDFETYEYNVEVDMDEIQILCDSLNVINGCNVKIDMSNKETYDHVIEVNNNDEVKKYTIHINKKKTEKEIRITSIEGIPDKWINKEVELKVNVETKGTKKLKYSFDGGKTWQDSNIIKIEENKIIKLQVKDEAGNKTDIKQIIINKIDKDKPKVEIIIESKSKEKIIIKAVGSDKTSTIDKYSFDQGAYSIVSTKEIKKAGTYSVKVKDQAGNESETTNIKITEKDFPKDDVKENEYKVELESNGATINSTVLKCKSYEETCKITLPTITRSGGTVIGWSTDKDSTKAEYKSGEILSIKKDIKLYAITSKTLTATFNKNSATSIGSTSQSCKIYNAETGCNITTPTITRSDWSIVGWDTNRTSNNVKVKQNATLKLTQSQTYYAITSKEITATFNKNSATSIGSTSQSCKMYNAETSCSIITPTITRSGWTSDGWNTSKTSKNVNIKPNSTLKLTENKTYYAITSKTLTATFNKNGATSIGSTSQSCKMYNSETSCSVTTPTITRTGGSAIGWNANKDSRESGIYPGSKLAMTGNATYYAITSKTISATFDKNTAQNVSYESKKCKIYNEKKSCKVKPPTITPNSGWSTVGWNYIEDATVALKETEEGITISSDTKYYAITKKSNKLTIKNGNSTINTISCDIYSPKDSCKVNFTGSPYKELNNLSYIYEANNKKYMIKGFANENGGSIVHKFDYQNRLELSLNGDKTIYINLIYMSNVFTKNKKTIYVEDGYYNTAKKRLDDICSWAPFLCNVEGDVFVFSRENFVYRWGDDYAGMTYGSLPRPIDLVVSQTPGLGNSYDTWMHEFAHGWDYKYEIKTGSRINTQSDFMKLYNYYVKNTTVEKPITASEFFAAMAPTYVYFKNGIDGSQYNFRYSCWKTFTTSNTETELKKYLLCVFDKYITISNNGYKTSSNTASCVFPY